MAQPSTSGLHILVIERKDGMKYLISRRNAEAQPVLYTGLHACNSHCYPAIRSSYPQRHPQAKLLPLGNIYEHGDASTIGRSGPVSQHQGPLLIRSHIHYWRDSMESNGLIRAAEKHLSILRLRQAVESEQYVRLAFGYGVEVDRIVELSGLSVAQVREILTAGAR